MVFINLGFLKRGLQIVEIVHGSAVTIQALHSDVILHVPDGVYGIILGNVHTDHWRFRHLVPENDCIIGPMCEFHVKGSKIPCARFRIQVPHIVSDIKRVRDYLKVRHMGSLDSSYITEENPAQKALHCPDTYYTVDNQYFNIFTPTFSKFLIFAEGINCCSDRTRVFPFSRKTSNGLNVRLYFCSPHYQEKDYHEVFECLSLYLYFKQVTNPSTGRVGSSRNLHNKMTIFLPITI